jgi:hypothetical protein
MAYLKPTSLWLFALMALCACGSATEPLSHDERAELAQARAKWNSAGLSNYVFEQRQLCFCPPGVGEWARVTVAEGRVVSAVRPEDGLPIESGSRLTVPQLFDVIEQARDDEFLQDIEVEFDAQYGYPTSIHLEAKPDVQDGGRSIQARALVAVR